MSPFRRRRLGGYRTACLLHHMFTAPSLPNVPIGCFNITSELWAVHERRLLHPISKVSPQLAQSRKIVSQFAHDVEVFVGCLCDELGEFEVFEQADAGAANNRFPD